MSQGVSVSSNTEIYRLSFRRALVIEESERFRRSMVDYLKHRGWIVHGVRRVEQALPILPRIPYHLILVDCDMSETTDKEFGPIMHELCKRQATRLLVFSGSSGRSSATDISQCGAFLAKRSTWKEDLSRVLSSIESADNVVQGY